MIKNLILFLTFLFAFTNFCKGQDKYLIPFLVGDKYGYSDEFGNMKIAPQFMDAELFTENKAYVVDSNGYRNIIDTNGRLILKGKYGNIQPQKTGMPFGILICFLNSDDVDIVNANNGNIILSSYVLDNPVIALSLKNEDFYSYPRYYIIKNDNTKIVYDFKLDKTIYKTSKNYFLNQFEDYKFKKGETNKICISKFKERPIGFGENESYNDSLAFIINGKLSKFFKEKKVPIEKKEVYTSTSVTTSNGNTETASYSSVEQIFKCEIFYKDYKYGIVIKKGSNIIDSIPNVYDEVSIEYDGRSFVNQTAISVKKNGKFGVMLLPSKNIFVNIEMDKIFQIVDGDDLKVFYKKDTFCFIKTKAEEFNVGKFDGIEYFPFQNVLNTNKNGKYGFLILPIINGVINKNVFELPPIYTAKFIEFTKIFPANFDFNKKDLFSVKGIKMAVLYKSISNENQLISNKFGYRTFKMLIDLNKKEFFSEK